MINYHTRDQEGDIEPQKQLTISPISRPYSGINNPRIVRVSRAFGGKDRHSKVLTVKGLRDRRIRLSVPTAVQLYHLQDQLGLNQPSKVIDWLLDATKDDIDKLPPLQMTTQDFNRFHIPPKFEPRDFNSTQLALSPFFNHAPSNNHDHIINHQRTNKGKQAVVVEQHNKYCCNHDSCDHHHHLQPSYSNLSLAANYYSASADPQLFSGSYGSMTPPFFAPYFVSNHFQLSNSAALNFSESGQEKVPFGLDMNSKVKFS